MWNLARIDIYRLHCPLDHVARCPLVVGVVGGSGVGVIDMVGVVL